ncbi:NAD(P)-binding domain-containing protein [Evansella sp. LMS18]|uniref:NAD(P)/FAD-dependent oxidoreductase n=1 Tax=Evansella sp. LMS18 TaxID=2924033 RepID=UPI0020D1AF4C|nr:NAD(P)/FAD-dependent oxidoreductase [Evansella sp. LMS18]UTR10140.1 NAD(P)-binding domain-containing protein [Evansella sp. LMS18]
MNNKKFDVIIVGAGPAGVGMGSVLRQLGLENFTILERMEVGATFKMWPEETRLLTPSFPGHGFGQLDLNAVVPATSPGYAYSSEHLTGEEYADYLKQVAGHFNLPVKTGITVELINKEEHEDKFVVHTDKGTFESEFVIWAAGEFQYPDLYPFEGSENCLHTSKVKSWSSLEQGDYYIIGGYESGIDAAYHLVKNGYKATVLSKGEPWNDDNPDPSVSLSPFTCDRLRTIADNKNLRLIGNAEIVKAEKDSGGFRLQLKSGSAVRTSCRPILANGYKSSLSLVLEHFYWNENGSVELTEKDESTVSDGLFLTGPQVKHGEVIFCFIYKFRQRFAIIAEELCVRLGIQVDQSVIQHYRQSSMFLDDLSCCDNSCQC